VNTQSDPTASAVDSTTDMIFSTDGGNGDLVQQNQYDGRGFRIVTRSYSNGTLAETRHAALPTSGSASKYVSAVYARASNEIRLPKR
jgi:hypothetical protein